MAPKAPAPRAPCECKTCGRAIETAADNYLGQCRECYEGTIRRRECWFYRGGTWDYSGYDEQIARHLGGTGRGVADSPRPSPYKGNEQP